LEAAESRRQHLLADVSHELRTPLTVLQGNLRAALDDVTPLDPPQIAKLYDQTRQISHLITDLHDVAQAEAKQLPLHMAGVEMVDLVQQVGDIFAPLVEADGIELTVVTPPIAPLMRGDRARLMQVLQNLMSNALRYARASITLTITAAADQLVLTVADDGEGIDPTHVEHIFDRFYRADSSRTRDTGGTGLGLAIVKSIVEAHGGTVSAQSAVDEGTRIIVNLPIDGGN
jgi:signal transduction histidine kinase